MDSIGSKEEGHEEQATLDECSEMALPGFRFHPTEEELVGYYLRRMVQGRRNSVELIASLDLYQYDPWDLPAMAFMGEKEWFFFCPRDKKYPNGARPNRVTASGYWKATGTDRPVRCSGDSRCIGLKKTLVFYNGRAPRGNKTEWIMNEYRMPKPAEKSISLMTSGVNSMNFSFSTYDSLVIKNDVALCRIYRKSSSTLNSITFISAIGSRELEERTSRMVSRFENNHRPVAAHVQQQQQHIHPIHNQRLQVQAPPPHTVGLRGSSSEMPVPSWSAALLSGNSNAHAQELTATVKTTTLSHPQLDETETQGQQQLSGGAAAQGSFDHVVVPSIIDCTATSEEAARQLQIALRTAMAKLGGVESSASLKFIDGKPGETMGALGIFDRSRGRGVQDANAAAASPSRRVMSSPSPAADAQNHNRSCSKIAAVTTQYLESFVNANTSSQELSTAVTPLFRNSPNPANVAAAAFTPFKDAPSCCNSTKISIPPSLRHHHVNSSPTTTATTLSVESATAASSTITVQNITTNSSYISASPIRQLEDFNACSIPPLTTTYSLKRSRLNTKVQQLAGESWPMAKMPSVAQYWRQSSSAPTSAATQLGTFDPLSGLTFQY